MEDQQHSVTQEIRESVSDAETCILSFLQGKFSALEEKIEGRFIGMEQKLEGTLSIMEQKMEEKNSKLEKKVQQALNRLILLPSAILTLTFDTYAHDVTQISCGRSGGLWVMADFELFQVDTDGNINHIVYSPGPFCVSKDDALLYMSHPFDEDEDKDEDEDEQGDCIKKKTSRGTIRLLKTENSEDVIGIHSSFVNGNILILIRNRNIGEIILRARYSYKIIRYNEDGVKIRDFWINNMIQGQLSYCDSAYITENRNEDIIISYERYTAVVGMDRSGGYRFTYSHPDDLFPMGICTDIYGHILVGFESSIHLLDEDGAFQKILLKSMPRNILTSLCLDDKHNLYVGNDHGVVKVYKYLKDE